MLPVDKSIKTKVYVNALIHHWRLIEISAYISPRLRRRSFLNFAISIGIVPLKRFPPRQSREFSAKCQEYISSIYSEYIDIKLKYLRKLISRKRVSFPNSLGITPVNKLSSVIVLYIWINKPLQTNYNKHHNTFFHKLWLTNPDGLQKSQLRQCRWNSANHWFSS